MRSLLTISCLLLTTACGDDTFTVRGFLDPESSATEVFVVGQPLRARIEADSFVIGGVSGDRVELEFAEEGDRRGRMRIERWSVDDIALRGIWFEDGVAFASGLTGEGAATVNGLRMAGEGELPRTVSISGTVLAASRSGDALIVRPHDERMPDLRVVVTPGTSIESEAGEAAEADFEFGDTLQVEGTTELGYVVATALVVRSPPAAEEAAVDLRMEEPVPEEREDDDEASEERREGPRSLQKPGRGKGRGRGLQLRRD